MAEPAPIERAFFREAPDGATVFFPFGLDRRAYRLPDEAARRRAERAASLLFGAVFAVATWAAYALQSVFESPDATLADGLRALVAPGTGLLVALLTYGLWAARFVEPLPEVQLHVSREERLREAAALVDPRQLTLAGVLLAGMSGLVAWLEPRGWWLAALGVAAGLGLVWWSHVLRRHRPEPQR